MCSSFAFKFVVRDFTLQSQLISDNKSQKAKDLHSRADYFTAGSDAWPFFGGRGPYQCVIVWDEIDYSK